MAGLGPRSAIERAEIGNSRPTVVRACALLDRAASAGRTIPAQVANEELDVYFFLARPSLLSCEG
jgi:hypothetical protein